MPSRILKSRIPLYHWEWLQATGLPSSCGASHFDYDNPCLDYFLPSFTEGEWFFNASCIPPTSALSLFGFVHLLSNQMWEEGKLGEDVT